MTFDGLEDELCFEQRLLGTRDDVGTGPAALGEHLRGDQQAPVVIADVLACDLDEQRASRVAQTQIRRAIHNIEREPDEPTFKTS